MPRNPTTQLEKELLKNLGFILREIRVDHGYTSIDGFAKENGFSVSICTRWESGKNMNILSTMRLCNTFLISLAELMDLWDTFNNRKTRHLYQSKKKELVERAQLMLEHLNNTTEIK